MVEIAESAPQLAPYGTWSSPLTAARVTAGTLRFDHIVLDRGDVYWVEGRASDGGRNVVVRQTGDGAISDVTPAGFNVRSRAHEYGGAAFTVHDETVYFSNFADQRVYRQPRGGAPQAITREGYLYADAEIDAVRARVIAVREDHTRGDAEPVNTITAVRCDGSHEDVLVSGADFYSDPILSPDGQRFAWLQWNHPDMPWDSTELWVALVAADGSLADRQRVAGGNGESLFQPTWSPDGQLYFVSDRSGWWNLYRMTSGTSEPIHPMPAEFGKPQWTFTSSTYAFIGATRLAAAYSERGRWKLALIDTASGEFTPLDLALEPLESIRATANAVYFIGGSPTQPPAIACLSIPETKLQVLRSASSDRIDDAWISVPEAISFTSNGEDVHAFHYRPTNPRFRAPDDERPPLIVFSHGGPTAATLDVLDGRIQFWTSRGFAVVDVNYSGSSGYGRAYRDRLKGEWGVLDVLNCVDAARHLVAVGKADPHRLIIRGGSAGGYTTLAALTFHDVFKAGASYYGISDIEVLARDTHKFEARYLDSMIGPYPEKKQLYIERSPIHFTERLSCALILFQGLEDKVVPPNQSEMMADAVRRKGLPVAYVPFAGEQHGFRKEANMIRSLEAELYFYAAVFGIPLSEPLQPVSIDNLHRQES